MIFEKLIRFLAVGGDDGINYRLMFLGCKAERVRMLQLKGAVITRNHANGAPTSPTLPVTPSLLPLRLIAY